MTGRHTHPGYEDDQPRPPIHGAWPLTTWAAAWVLLWASASLGLTHWLIALGVAVIGLGVGGLALALTCDYIRRDDHEESM